MAQFTERQEHKLEIIPPFSIIQCRRADIIEKDGVEVGRTYHRHVRVPGDDVSQDDCTELQAVAAVLWTPEVIAAYQASISASTAPQIETPAPTPEPVVTEEPVVPSETPVEEPTAPTEEPINTP
jgi:hypothetical protein